MVYLINLSKEDYLNDRIPEKDALQSAITFDGKYLAKMIPYSVEFEQQPTKDRPSQIDKIIKAGYEEL